jgi:hypothetical protein
LAGLLPAAAEAPPAIRNNYGTVGLIDMPSARIPKDGELAAGFSYMRNIQHYNFDFQILPWLEGSFRYSGIDHFNVGIPIYYDRAFGMKARLWQEGAILPAVVIGVNDLVGTGIYASEYVAASKQFGDFDATIGIGWGRLGTANSFRNPLSLISDRFSGRQGFGLGQPGNANFGQFFRGPTAGVFGGMTWRTPIDGLTLIAELSSDAYVQEATRGLATDAKAFIPKSQFNFGASYQLGDNVLLGLDWMYGTSVGGSIAFQLDPVTDPYPVRIGPEPPQPRTRSPEEQQRALKLLLDERNGTLQAHGFADTEKLVDALWAQSLPPRDVSIQGRSLFLVMPQGNPDTICRAAAALVGNYQADITLVMVAAGRRKARCLVAATPPLTVPSALRFDPGATAISDLVLPPQPLVIDASDVAPSTASVIARIRADAKQQNIIVQAVDISATEATVYYTNTRYYSEYDAIDRLTRILMNDAPPAIEKFRLLATVNSLVQRQFEILREPAERSLIQTGSIDIPRLAEASSAPLYNPLLAAATKNDYPRFYFQIFPQFRQEFFDITNPFAVQFLAGGIGSLELFPGFSLTGEAELNLYDNFNVTIPAVSDLPHVRTDFLKFFSEGANGIGNLEADYRFRLTPEVFALARVGYLESMYAGVGGEILWRPDNQRWSLGADLYAVRERDFDRLFGLQHYSVVTGHVSLRYASPWYNLNFEMRAGRYLAGDYGVTLKATRRFETGVEIGAFMTKTNVSSARFGEGSFDKGIFIRIPLDWVVPVQTQGEYSLNLRPVQRDGGQPLEGDEILYYETYRTSDPELNLHAPAFSGL